MHWVCEEPGMRRMTKFMQALLVPAEFNIADEKKMEKDVND